MDETEADTQTRIDELKKAQEEAMKNLEEIRKRQEKHLRDLYKEELKKLDSEVRGSGPWR